MLLGLTHTTGSRVTEPALLEIGDVLYPAARSSLRCTCAQITKGCRPRNVYLIHDRCLTALAMRLQSRWDLFGVDEYRGLRPSSKLVMTLEREAFELAFKQRELEVPGL
jgi:integrase/recombinase XerD